MNQPKTMGQALDAAVSFHAKLHPGSQVYEATVTSFAGSEPAPWRVEVQATHFSVPLVYAVSRAFVELMR